MPITYGQNSHVSALDVAFSIHADVESTIYDIFYPEHEYPNILLPEQIKTDINAGATSVSYMTRDHKGVAAFIGHGPNNDIPMVGQSMGAIDVPLAVSAVGFRITNEDARQYQFGFNAELGPELGDAAAQAAENLKERSIIFGNPELRFKPWINYPGIAIIPSPAHGGSGRWVDKSPEQKAETLNIILRTMWEETRTLFTVTDLFLPMAIFADAVNTPMAIGGGPTLAVSVMEYFKANNLNNALNNAQQVTIHASRYLSDAGADGQSRIVAMCRNSKNQVWPNPLEYRVGQPVPEPLGAAWYGEQKFGSYHIRQQGSMLYMDGI